ncbi:MAG: hypothetical protein HKP41_20120 [Desulfobacterales bacterium]|nr:hypothetical protein [Desulfobacterales bacterium]
MKFSIKMKRLKKQSTYHIPLVADTQQPFVVVVFALLTEEVKQKQADKERMLLLVVDLLTIIYLLQD